MDYEATPAKMIMLRRRHAPQIKLQVLDEFEQPGVSVASVTLRHGINQLSKYQLRQMTVQLLAQLDEKDSVLDEMLAE